MTIIEPEDHNDEFDIHSDLVCFIFFLRFYLFIFRERGKKGEREGEKHQCVVASYMSPSGDLAHNPGMCPDWELNWWPFALQPAFNPLSHTSKGLGYFLMFVVLLLGKNNNSALHPFPSHPLNDSHLQHPELEIWGKRRSPVRDINVGQVQEIMKEKMRMVGNTWFLHQNSFRTGVYMSRYTRT